MDKQSLFALLKKLRGPFFLSILFTLIWFVVLFPTSDLGDLVSTKVSEFTQNQVFLQFDEFSFDVAPPGVEFSNVFLESPFFPGFSAETISIAPSVSGMISQKPYGTVKAQGFLDGTISATVKKGQATDAGVERHRLLLDVEKISLASVREMLKWTTAFEGRISLTADGQGDLALNEQPDVDLKLEVDKFALPPATINTMMGPLTLPDMKLGIIHLKGRLSNGKFLIESGEIGKKQDDLFGKIKGSWNVQLMMMGGRPVPQLGAYDFEVDLVANKQFQAKAGLFLSLLDQYKTMTGDGARYQFKVSGADLYNPPSINATR
ncbi:MAG: hypothetical protein RJB66_356 [Pseudomonadota bacterium]|jgi:type II secretion system protein N